MELKKISSLFSDDQQEDTVAPYGSFRGYDRNSYYDIMNSFAKRGSRRCGRVKYCLGVCCASKECCRKGWVCRYLSSQSTFACTP